MVEKLIFLTVFLLISLINGLPSKSYYLIDLVNSDIPNENYCSNILINQELYRIPEQCRHHLLCNPYYCDDKSFRCVKIREALCCLHKYFQTNCQQDNTVRIKDLFRSIYFQMSIEHGYCEINLERIERNDGAYCIANSEETQSTTTAVIIPSSITLSTTMRSSIKYVQRRPNSLNHYQNRQRIASRQNYSVLLNSDHLRHFNVKENVASTCSTVFINVFLFVILLLTILI